MSLSTNTGIYRSASMDIKEVYCELFTKDSESLADTILEELEIDEARLSEFLKHHQNLAFTAKYKDEVCGFIYGYTLMSLSTAPQLFIYAVDVLSKFQNKGIGSKLFQYVVEYSRENGFSECFVMTNKSNKSACRVYEKAGGKSDYEDEILYVIEHNKN